MSLVDLVVNFNQRSDVVCCEFLTNLPEEHASIYEKRGFVANRNLGYLSEYRKALKEETK